MSEILEHLSKIKKAFYGEEVRGAIHDAIQQCYYDGKAGTIDLEARQLLNTKADKTDISTPYNFKGSCLFGELPAESNEVNDTYYCTDMKCKYTWNGSEWYQSSLNESDYEEQLGTLSSEIVDFENIVLSQKVINSTDYSKEAFYIDNTPMWVQSPTAKCCLIPLSYGDTLSVSNTTGSNTSVAFLTVDTIAQNKTPSFSADHPAKIVVENNSKWESKVGKNERYLYVYTINTKGENVFPNIVIKRNSADSDFNVTLQNQMWSWWIYPQVVSFKNIRNKIYWSWTSESGNSGISDYDLDTKEVTNTVIKRSNKTDDHNSIAFTVLPSGKIVTAYSTGHNEDNKMCVRVSSAREYIGYFEEPIELECCGLTSYAQLLYTTKYNKLLLFYRAGINTWCMRYSVDEGITWSEEVILFTSEYQYYCMFRWTTEDGTIRVLMTSNPDAEDANIRQAFLHLGDMSIYNSDNSTLLGVNNIVSENVNVLIPLDSSYDTQRLFDCARTAPTSPLILYTVFNMSTSEYSNSMYRIFNNGDIKTFCKGGVPLWNPKYQCGASFLGTIISDVNSIVSVRGDTDTDVIEIYDLDGNIKETVLRNERVNSIRTFRPICDIYGKAFLYLHGYYNDEVYTDFSANAILNIN